MRGTAARQWRSAWPATLLAGAGFGQSARLINLGGLFQRASIITGSAWLTARWNPRQGRTRCPTGTRADGFRRPGALAVDGGRRRGALWLHPGAVCLPASRARRGSHPLPAVVLDCLCLAADQGLHYRWHCAPPLGPVVSEGEPGVLYQAHRVLVASAAMGKRPPRAVQALLPPLEPGSGRSADMLDEQ
jgi:hypothetical protein